MAHGAAGWSPGDRQRRAAPDLWSLAVLGLALVFGIMLLAVDWDSGPWGVAAGVVAAALAAAAGLWMRDRIRAGGATEYFPPPPRVSWTLAFQIPEGRVAEASGEGSLVPQLEALVGRDFETLASARILMAPAATGPTQAIVETVWSEAGAEQDELDSEIERVIAAHPDMVVDGSIYRLSGEIVRDRHEQAVRLPIALVTGGVAAMGIAGFGLAALLSAFQEPGTVVGPPVDGQPTAAPQVFEGVIVEKGIKFETDEFQLPPNTEVTLTEDNQDPSVPHNIRFFAGPDLSGAVLTGCTSGCDGSDVVTPVNIGLSQHEFTFTTPGVGSYAFRCDVHPTTMTGVMTIAEGAPVP